MRQMTQQMTTDGGPPQTMTYPEAAAQTFEMGAPVVLNASGQVQEAVAAGAASVVGVAAMPANGAGASRYLPPSTGQPVTVWVANGETLFGVLCAGAVAADIGKKITIKKTGALWAADHTTVGTAGSFIIQAIGTEINTGNTYIIGKWLESATQLAYTA